MNNAVGAHVSAKNPLAEAAKLGAEAIQVFLGSPRGWKAPAKQHRLAAVLAGSEKPVFVHAPYLVNLCSGDSEVRQKSVNSLAANLWSASSIGARGVVVHGGHATDGGDPHKRWKEAFAQLADVIVETGVPLLVENTASGENAAAVTPGGLAKVLELGNKAVKGWRGSGPAVAAVLDTCHGWAAGWTGAGFKLLEDEMVALIHANGSADRHGSRVDHHTNFEDEENKVADFLLVEIFAKYSAPVVVETPGGVEGQSADVAYLKKLIANIE